jgi:hypothetical protein
MDQLATINGSNKGITTNERIQFAYCYKGLSSKALEYWIFCPHDVDLHLGCQDIKKMPHKVSYFECYSNALVVTGNAARSLLAFFTCLNVRSDKKSFINGNFENALASMYF